MNRWIQMDRNNKILILKMRVMMMMKKSRKKKLKKLFLHLYLLRFITKHLCCWQDLMTTRMKKVSAVTVTVKGLSIILKLEKQEFRKLMLNIINQDLHVLNLGQMIQNTFQIKDLQDVEHTFIKGVRDKAAVKYGSTEFRQISLK